MSRVQKGTLGTGANILYNKDYNAKTFTVDGSLEVDGKSVVMEDGRKIVKAGSFIKGKTTPLLKGGTIGVLATDGTVEGILYDDVDITDGAVEGSLVVRGNINETKLPVAAAEEVEAALKTRILLMK